MATRFWVQTGICCTRRRRPHSSSSPTRQADDSQGHVQCLARLCSAVADSSAGTGYPKQLTWECHLSSGQTAIEMQLHLIAQVFGGAVAAFAPGSFMQVNYDMMDAALAAIQSFVPDSSQVCYYITHAG
jgi:hypothetical protein